MKIREGRIRFMRRLFELKPAKGGSNKENHHMEKIRGFSDPKMFPKGSFH